MNTLSILLLGLLTLSSCRDTLEREPERIDFRFIVVDSLDNDLFFAENSNLNPYDVIFTVYGDSGWYSVGDYHLVDSSNFHISGYANTDRDFFMQFIPGRIDTITFTPNEIATFYKAHFNVSYNSSAICNDCKEQIIYKININE